MEAIFPAGNLSTENLSLVKKIYQGNVFLQESIYRGILFIEAIFPAGNLSKENLSLVKVI